MKRLLEHEWLKILLYLVLTIVLGALLAPWLFNFGKYIVRQEWFADGPAPLAYLHGALERSPFSRYFKRAVMIVAFIGLIPLIRSLHFRGWKDLQIHKNPCAAMDVAAGSLLAAAFLLFMGAAFLYMGFFVPEDEAQWDVIPKILATAITVAIIEEIFFRGAILGVCLRKMPVFLATILTSAIYALLHFLNPPRLELGVADVHWSTGFEMLKLVFSDFLDWQKVAAEFLTLFVIGLVLAVTRLRTRSLWLPIGLHAGWVFGYQLYNENTDDSSTIEQWFPWVGEDLKVGLIPLIVITVTGALASLWIDLSRKPTFETAPAEGNDGDSETGDNDSLA